MDNEAAKHDYFDWIGQGMKVILNFLANHLLSRQLEYLIALLFGNISSSQV